jgi:hypothetical protein
MSKLIHPQPSILFSPSELHAGSRITIHLGGDVESCTRVHNAFATKELQQYRYYTTHLFMCQPDPTHHHV